MIEWSDALSVGVPEIDDQHCAFVGLVNRLTSALGRSDPDRADLREVLADVATYAEVHFSEEERCMLLAGYPLQAEHAAKHHAATAKIKSLMIKDADDMDMYRFLCAFLRGWLVRHIMGDDKAFGEWLQQRRALNGTT